MIECVAGLRSVVDRNMEAANLTIGTILINL